MNHDKNLELLFQYASTYKFNDFTELFLKLTPSISADELREAHLIRAQIKLFAADETLMDDLEKADGGQAMPRFPCLKTTWVPDTPNRFVVFKKTPGALDNFLRILPQCTERLSRWYGEMGTAMVHQVQSEILYFARRYDDALRLVKGRKDSAQRHCTDAILQQYVAFRCYLAMGLHKAAQQSMLAAIRAAKIYPECFAPYIVVRNWANLTTGWSGDTPRFADVAPGKALPVLEDRIAAIRQGISRLSSREEPFVAYAAQAYRETYTMRQYYMDIFNAIYWFLAEDHPQGEAYFMQAYRISSSSGLIMPFVEYGRQIMPLLEHMRSNGTTCSHDWITSVASLAEQYEESLQAYRA